MPINANFPKRQTYASEEIRGLMTKEDVSFLKSLQDKLDIVGNIIGRKTHSFASLNDVKESINLKDGDIVVALGDSSILDDGYIRVLKISDDPSWLSNKAVFALNHLALYAKVVLKIVDCTTVNNELASILTSFTRNVEVKESEISSIIASAGVADCDEIVNSRVDENDIVYTSMKQRINSIADFCNNRGIKRYGVRFVGSRHYGDRLYNAYGMKAKASTDTYKGTNDFDNIYPWSRITRCNGYYTEEGFKVTAYDGEPGFALDGSNGNVWVEIPKFFIKENLDSNGNLVMELCSAEVAGYRLPSKFIDGNGDIKEKVYIAAYNFSAGGSISGANPISGSYNELLQKIQELGPNFCGYTTEDHEIIRFLFCIEYATRNSQSVMYGATKLTQSVELSAANNTNSLTIASTSVKFVVGEECSIIDTNGDIVIESVTISGVSNDSNYTYITIDADPIDILEGYKLCAKPWKTGTTDTVLSASGSPKSNTSGYYPCRYRYIENPWGNQWSVLYQIVSKQHTVYFCKQATALSKIVNKNNKVGYTLPKNNGYIMELGFDDKYPSCRLPINIEGGNSFTSYSDMYITDDSSTVNAVLVGGYIDNNVSGGLHCINIINSLDYSSLWIGTRLSFSK